MKKNDFGPLLTDWDLFFKTREERPVFKKTFTAPADFSGDEAIFKKALWQAERIGNQQLNLLFNGQEATDPRVIHILRWDPDISGQDLKIELSKIIQAELLEKRKMDAPAQSQGFLDRMAKEKADREAEQAKKDREAEMQRYKPCLFIQMLPETPHYLTFSVSGYYLYGGGASITFDKHGGNYFGVFWGAGSPGASGSVGAGYYWDNPQYGPDLRNNITGYYDEFSGVAPVYNIGVGGHLGQSESNGAAYSGLTIGTPGASVTRGYTWNLGTIP